MQWVGYAELAAAVSNAGGLGIVRAKTNYNNYNVTNEQLTPLSSQLSHNPPLKTSAKRSADAAP